MTPVQGAMPEVYQIWSSLESMTGNRPAAIPPLYKPAASNESSSTQAQTK